MGYHFVLFFILFFIGYRGCPDGYVFSQNTAAKEAGIRRCANKYVRAGIEKHSNGGKEDLT